MIRFENASKTFPDGTEAVKEVSFEVKKGEVCVLLGPSGCGKTTTMKMVNRLIPLTAGKIYIDVVDNTKLDENELRRGIGYAIQNIGLFPHMTVEENIETVPSLKGWSKHKKRERVKELLELIQLPPGEFLNKYPRELSGGQLQRVGVARALGGDPPVLLMDEPFGAIDPATRVQLQDEFIRIQREIHKTVIFVTHDISEAIRVGDQIALMRGGRLVQYAPPGELLFRPRDPFVEDFVGADSALKGLQLIPAKEVMLKAPPSVAPHQSTDSARDHLKVKWDWAVVLEKGERVKGWVFENDLAKGERVTDVMVEASDTVSSTCPANEVLSLMLTSASRVIAVTDSSGGLEGVITFEAIRERLKEESST